MADAGNTAQLLLSIDASTELLRRELAVARQQIDGFEVGAVKSAGHVEKSFGDMGKGAGLARVQLLELTHIGKSLFDSIAAGTSPMRAFTVEGGRIAQVVTGAGGIGPAFSGLLGIIGGPFVAALLAGGGALAFLATRGSAAQSEITKLQRALDVTGNTANITAEGVQLIGARVAETTGKSVAASTEIAASLAKSGQFTKAEIEQLSAAALGLSERTGEASDKIVAEFVKAADGPTAYAREYAKSYAGLSAPTIEHIRQLEDQGDKQGALQVLSQALYGYLGGKAPGQLGIVERAWVGLGRAISNANSAVGDYIRRQAGVGGTSPLHDQITGQIDAITNSSSVQRGYGLSPEQTARVAALKSQLAIADALTAATQRGNAAVAAYNKTQREGAAASADLATKYGSVGDNLRKAHDETAKFRADLARALKANPNDAEALRAKANQPAIEADILKRNTPDTQTALAKAKSDAAAHKAAVAKAEAERIAAINANRDFEKELGTAVVGEAEARAAISGTAADRLKIERGRVEQARVAYNSEAALKGPKANGGTGKYTTAELAQLQALNDQTAAEKQIKLTREAQHAVDERALALTTDGLQAQVEYFGIQSGLADTAQERREIELRILALQKEIERKTLKATIDNPVGRDEDKGVARQQLGGLDAKYDARSTAVVGSTRNPLESYLKTLPTDAARATEALQAVEASGLKALSGGITDAITGAKSLGSAFKEVTKSIIADLIRIGVEKAIIGPLGNALFGGSSAGGSSGGGGLFSSFFSSILHREGGGSVTAGQPYVVGEKRTELFVPSVSGRIEPQVPQMRVPGIVGQTGGTTVNISQPVSLHFDVGLESVDQRIGQAAPVLLGAAQKGTFDALKNAGIGRI